MNNNKCQSQIKQSNPEKSQIHTKLLKSFDSAVSANNHLNQKRHKSSGSSNMSSFSNYGKFNLPLFSKIIYQKNHQLKKCKYTQVVIIECRRIYIILTLTTNKDTLKTCKVVNFKYFAYRQKIQGAKKTSIYKIEQQVSDVIFSTQDYRPDKMTKKKGYLEYKIKYY